MLQNSETSSTRTAEKCPPATSFKSNVFGSWFAQYGDNYVTHCAWPDNIPSLLESGVLSQAESLLRLGSTFSYEKGSFAEASNSAWYGQRGNPLKIEAFLQLFESRKLQFKTRLQELTIDSIEELEKLLPPTVNRDYFEWNTDDYLKQFFKEDKAELEKLLDNDSVTAEEVFAFQIAKDLYKKEPVDMILAKHWENLRPICQSETEISKLYFLLTYLRACDILPSKLHYQICTQKGYPAWNYGNLAILIGEAKSKLEEPESSTPKVGETRLRAPFQNKGHPYRIDLRNQEILLVAPENELQPYAQKLTYKNIRYVAWEHLSPNEAEKVRLPLSKPKDSLYSKFFPLITYAALMPLPEKLCSDILKWHYSDRQILKEWLKLEGSAEALFKVALIESIQHLQKSCEMCFADEAIKHYACKPSWWLALSDQQRKRLEDPIFKVLFAKNIFDIEELLQIDDLRARLYMDDRFKSLVENNTIQLKHCAKLSPMHLELLASSYCLFSALKEGWFTFNQFLSTEDHHLKYIQRHDVCIKNSLEHNPGTINSILKMSKEKLGLVNIISPPSSNHEGLLPYSVLAKAPLTQLTALSKVSLRLGRITSIQNISMNNLLSTILSWPKEKFEHFMRESTLEALHQKRISFVEFCGWNKYDSLVYNWIGAKGVRLFRGIKQLWNGKNPEEEIHTTDRILEARIQDLDGASEKDSYRPKKSLRFNVEENMEPNPAPITFQYPSPQPKENEMQRNSDEPYQSPRL